MKRYLCSLFILCWSFTSCNLNKTNPNQRDSQNSSENLKSSQIAFSTSLISSYNSLPEVEESLKTQESLLELDNLTMKYDKDNKRVIYYYPQKEALNPLNIVIVYYPKNHPDSQKAGQYFTELKAKTDYQPSFDPKQMGILISKTGEKILSKTKSRSFGGILFAVQEKLEEFPFAPNKEFSFTREILIKKSKDIYPWKIYLEILVGKNGAKNMAITCYFSVSAGDNPNYTFGNGPKYDYPDRFFPDLEKAEITGWYDISKEDIQYFTSIMKACEKIQKS